MVIYQGDQYELPITVKRGDSIITPQDVDDLVIAVNDVAKSYSNNEIRFYDGKWLFPLSKEDTLAFVSDVKYQVELHKNGVIVHSKQYNLKSKQILDVLRRRLDND